MPHTRQPTPPAHHTGFLRLTKRDDADQLSADLAGWNQHYDQLTGGPFEGVLQETRLTGMQLFREYTSTGLRQSGQLAPSVIGFGLPATCPGRADFCGQLAEGDALHIFSGSNGFEFHSAPGQEMLCLSVPAGSLEPHLEPDDLRILTPAPGASRLLPLRPARAAVLRRHLAEGLSVGGLAAGELTSGEAVREAAFLRRTADLLSGVGEAEEAPRHARPTARSREIFHDAIAHALSQDRDEKLSILHICRALLVSRRSLHYAFHAHADMAPERYLRMLRLNRARRMIKAGATVTEAATHWGFWHLGRFSGAYQALFGELPSATATRSAR